MYTCTHIFIIHTYIQDCIVHTYAACCVERMLTTKDGTILRVSKADLQPMLQPLLVSLFSCLNQEASKENPHIMKCVFLMAIRVLCVHYVCIMCTYVFLTSKENPHIMKCVFLMVFRVLCVHYVHVCILDIHGDPSHHEVRDF